jgi:hypothetical protein
LIAVGEAAPALRSLGHVSRKRKSQKNYYANWGPVLGKRASSKPLAIE